MYISMLFTVTNFIPLSLTFACFLLCIPFLMAQEKVWHKLILATTILLLYFFVWTLVYDSPALINYSFYRRDGNVFATLLPIILFGLMKIPFNIEKLAIYFVYLTAFLNFFGMLAYKFWSFGLDYHGGCYCSFFLTHNAAGGFLSMLTALSIGLWVYSKSKVALLCLIINGAALYMSDSRGSLLALMGAVFIYFLLKEKYVKTVVGLSVLATIAIVWTTYPMWEASGRDLSYVSADADVLDQAVKLNFERSYTFVDRALFLWPRAVYLWLQSPLIGTGYGSYNDLPYQLEGIRHLLMINYPAEYIYSDGHAHHSFFHILGETGLIGLILTVIMLVIMRKFILELESKFLRTSLALMFWVAVWSSMTEHRLFTPSQMLPFTLLLGFVLGNERVKIKEKIIIPKHFLQMPLIFRRRAGL